MFFVDKIVFMKDLTFQTHLCSLLACRRQVLAVCLLEHLAKEQGKADRGGDGGEKGCERVFGVRA